jgi:hypothetical protein
VVLVLPQHGVERHLQARGAEAWDQQLLIDELLACPDGERVLPADADLAPPDGPHLGNDAKPPGRVTKEAAGRAAAFGHTHISLDLVVKY